MGEAGCRVARLGSLTKGFLVSPQSRRRFVLSAGAVATSVSVIGQVVGAPAVEEKADEPPLDPVAQAQPSVPCPLRGESARVVGGDSAGGADADRHGRNLAGGVWAGGEVVSADSAGLRKSKGSCTG